MQTPEENLSLVQQELSGDFNLPVTNNKQQLIEALAEGINYLIQADFSRLLNILYRIDSSEQTLEQQADMDAGLLIADLIIERQLQKQKIRAQFKPEQNIPDDDKW